MIRKAKRRKPGKSILITFLLLAVIAVSAYISLGNRSVFEREYEEKNPLDSSLSIRPDATDNGKKPAPPSKEPAASVSISFDQLNSPNAILLQLSDGAVMMEKNSEERIYPASLTKMMTAIVAIESLLDLKEKIKLTGGMFEELYEEGASMAGFLPGEEVRAIDLLYGVLLPSGAECCIGLADHIAGSEQAFVTLMNQKAAELGMQDTHFDNTTGLHSKNHYTTVKDLAVLLRYALQNETFREILTSSRHSVKPTNKHPEGITFFSTMFEELNNRNIEDGEIIGGKTGYTSEAGLCLASLARVGHQEYILVSAGARGDHHSEQYNITDAFAVYNSIENEGVA